MSNKGGLQAKWTILLSITTEDVIMRIGDGANITTCVFGIFVLLGWNF